jgi:hypothetical protein
MLDSGPLPTPPTDANTNTNTTPTPTNMGEAGQHRVELADKGPEKKGGKSRMEYGVRHVDRQDGIPVADR